MIFPTLAVEEKNDKKKKGEILFLLFRKKSSELWKRESLIVSH